MKLYIKNMVCDRCRLAVRTILENMKIQPLSVTLGEVEIKNEIDGSQKEELNKALQSLGFELMDNKKSRLIERIKNLIIELVHHKDNELQTNLSVYLVNQLHHDYHYLSTLFSEVEGTTIEKYFIAQKIEKIKELIVYDELSLSEIAFRLNYSSVAYLSSQFKKVTGLTPSQFKQLSGSKRKPLNEV